MAPRTPVQANSLRQSSPFLQKRPQKRLNLNERSMTWTIFDRSAGEASAEIVGLTGHGGAPIMQRSIAILLRNFSLKGRPYVVYVSAAVEPQKEARTRFPQTHEHEERPESVGPSPSQRPRAFDGVGLRAHGLPPPLFSSSRDVSQSITERSGRTRNAGVKRVLPGPQEPDDVARCRRPLLLSSSQPRY
jgi:hypothetical protein